MSKIILLIIFFFSSGLCFSQNSLSLKKPFGGEVVQDTLLINWEKESNNGSLSIFLWTGEEWLTIDSNVLQSSENYTWVINSNYNYNNCRIKLVSNETGVTSLSQAYFSIAHSSPKINIEKTEVAVNSIELFPNPADDILYINGSNEFKSIMIYNNSGELVLETKMIENAIDISLLPRGSYYCKGIKEKSISSFRFIKK